MMLFDVMPGQQPEKFLADELLDDRIGACQRIVQVAAIVVAVDLDGDGWRNNGSSPGLFAATAPAEHDGADKADRSSVNADMDILHALLCLCRLAHQHRQRRDVAVPFDQRRTQPDVLQGELV